MQAWPVISTANRYQDGLGLRPSFAFHDNRHAPVPVLTTYDNISFSVCIHLSIVHEDVIQYNCGIFGIKENKEWQTSTKTF